MNPALSATRARAYLAPVLTATPRLLGALDRERHSPTWGSFDRDHWAWKFRDQPINMLQAGVLPLAWLWRTPAPGNPWSGNGMVRQWILGAIGTILDRQHRNGSFDTVGPNTQDHGVTLAQSYVLLGATRLLGDACPDPLGARISEAVRRATDFARRSDEDYAFISNHQALFALTWLRAARHLGDDALLQRADEVTGRILAHQSPDGWFTEYGGPDPGYESLTLQHLAELEVERPGAALSEAIDRSLEFLAHCVEPDGGFGGGYASRHTIQWYPAGFELLSRRSPEARAIAGFIRPRLGMDPVVTPRSVDGHNLPLLLHSYCLAASVADGETEVPAAVPLPCERDGVLRHFPDSGLVVASTPRYFALCGLKKGGVLTVHDKRGGRIAYEDAGYLARSGRGEGQDWSSACLGLTRSCGLDGSVASSEAAFGHLPRPVLTPGRFLVLRLLNLTLFRSLVLGAMIRRMIIARLITRRRAGRMVLRREVQFEPEQLTVRDHLAAHGQGVQKLWRPRSCTTVHMGSARYYHPRDLVELPEAELTELAARLNREGAVDSQAVIRFDPVEEGGETTRPAGQPWPSQPS